MEEIRKDNVLKYIFLIFIIMSIIHIIYASLTMRGMYCDGVFIFLKQLDNLSIGKWQFEVDNEHSRFFIMMIQQIPFMIAYKFLFIKDKFALMIIDSFFQFAIPFLAVLWNYALTKRTNRIDVLFWNILMYGAVLCTFMIFSLVETLLGVTFQFILWNYLVSDINYKKRDIFLILFLIIVMFGTYEYVSYMGILFFIVHFHYVMKSKSLKSQAVKTIIGLGSLAAAIFNIVYMINVKGEDNEIARFITEATNYLPHIFELNTLISLVAVLLLFIFAFKKNKISYIGIIIAIVVYSAVFIKLLLTSELSVNPMWETHIRTLPCILMPLICLFLYIKDVISNKINSVKYYNFICIALLCCIFQTMWQMVDTYWWNENIKFMKSELKKEKDVLYIPSNHDEEIGSFFNTDLRRYIWHGAYAITSIAFSDTYKQKTLLVNYDETQEDGNLTYRNRLYVVPENFEKLNIPYGAEISIKNQFWDLTDCAYALDKYNKENNIETDR